MAIAQQAPSTKLVPVPFTDVLFHDDFWAPRLRINRQKSIPHAFRMCQETGRIDNFAKAAGLIEGDFRGTYFDDSDVYKNIEAASYSLATEPDPHLDKCLDDLIATIAAAQQKDGYLFTFYTLKGLDKRWTNLKDMHEMYCAGHLIEAAVAHYRATGKPNLLDVARKLADHIDSIFGPGKRQGLCGHEEIELALVKLYNLTNEPRYLDLARFFLGQRGNAAGHQLWGPYHQDHMSVIRQSEAVGHAVRAAYLYCGMADVAAATGDQPCIAALDRLWDNVVSKKMYITGGIGARHAGESFGDDYELPNESAYAETCAAIGNAFWNQRMFLLHAHARYPDVLERVIYNGFLSGLSLSGDRFFYVNPLASRGHHHRQPWYGCACCPVNVTRFLPSLPGYVFAVHSAALYVNLYVACTAVVSINGARMPLVQQTRYPWDGFVKLTIDPPQPAAFDVKLRIPGWCQGARLTLNGKDIDTPPPANGYAVISRQWSSGDTIELDLPMPVRRVKADPNVKADIGRVALQRGPIVYCLEAADNAGRVYNLSLPPDSAMKAEHHPDLLGGVTVIKGKALARVSPSSSTPVDFLAVPYYSWDNRAPGQMIVWIPEDPSLAQPPPVPTIASTSKPSASHCGSSDTLEALSDQLDPANSNDLEIPRFTWQDHKGAEEWVQYDFKSPQTIRQVEVYWFDDARTSGSCRVPASWKLLYRDADTWKPVPNPTFYPTALDSYNKVSFDPVATTALRLVVQLQPAFSAGILEWRVK